MTHRPLLALLEDSVDKELSPDELAELTRLLEESADLRADREASVRLKELLRHLNAPDPGHRYFDELTELIVARTGQSPQPLRRQPAEQADERALFTRSLVSAVASIFLFLAALFVGSQDHRAIASLSGSDGVLMTSAIARHVDRPEFALVNNTERSRISQGLFLLSPPGLSGYLVTGLPEPGWPGPKSLILALSTPHGD